ncbi:MAG: O-methyltransferase [Terriglobia bacterium]
MLEPGIQKYLDSLLPPRDAVLRDMERYATQHNTPIVGPACARALHELARAIKARRIFEMGSAIGYSTLWLARAAGPKGMVYYTDSDPENARRAEAYLRRGGVLSRVKLLVGNALELLKATPGQFDMIFNDVDKPYYPAVLRLATPRIRPGGLLVTDNVLGHGRVAQPAVSGEASTAAVQKFNRQLYRSKQFFTIIIPLRDGLAVSLKN